MRNEIIFPLVEVIKNFNVLLEERKDLIQKGHAIP